MFSQDGIDGVLEAIFHAPGFVPPKARLYVEIGTQTAHECNTRLLRQKWNWSGLMLDDDEENAYVNLQRATVGPWNINALLGLAGMPRDFDLLSIDIDGMDALVWLAIDDSRFHPRVVVVEAYPYRGDVVHLYPGDSPGTSYEAFVRIGRAKGYSLVAGPGAELPGTTNLVFVRDELRSCLPVLNVSGSTIPRKISRTTATRLLESKWVPYLRGPDVP